ncbi:hypothetical protein L9F63_017255, partial [Diploptera punctata]
LSRPSNEEPEYKEDDYANDDYDDGDEDGDDQYTGPPPTMISKPLIIEAHEGDTVSLPCIFTNMGYGHEAWKYSSIWKKEDKFLFTDEHRASGVDKRIMYFRQNNSLVIHNIKKEDAGTFKCIISYSPSLEIQHTVHIFSVQWTKKGKHEGSEVVVLTNEPNITLESVDRKDSGIYECSAENNQGPKVSTSHTNSLDYNHMLLFADVPEINVEEEVVVTGENYDARLKCIVHADPKASVWWLKNGQPISLSDHILSSSEGHAHILDIDKVKSEDFAKYTCKANNTLGSEESKVIEVTGKPGTPRLISAVVGSDGKSLDVEWHIISYSPMVEYKLLYRQAGEK